MSIEDRAAALGLTQNVKRVFDINRYDVSKKSDRVKLRGIVKNHSALDSTREACLDALEGYEASKAKTKASKGS